MPFQGYAEFYDTFYKRKPYRKECLVLEAIFDKYLTQKPTTILDLGCGTGNHMLALLKRGYHVSGIDASPDMLKVAKQKLKDSGFAFDLKQAKLQSFNLKKTFDTVVCLFSVIDYVTTKADILAAFKNAAAHLKKDGLFIFDFWNESAVEGYYAEKKTRTFRLNGQALERSSETILNKTKRLCEVHYTCVLKEKKSVIREDKEVHVLRYFSLDEIKEYLTKSGFQFCEAHPFLNVDGQIRKNTWDITVVARKI